eukprot:gnl/TRDRNA2_/TRDRNA2_175841_c2_seq12.p1 gnl/TRDRNA2_/TRDRNA2_175841_c2~~gnl/TRDRNA2_/TRDRNA2_175841_c2_seq12.p1  ORF type:complete len:246 (-),score=6.77 gnl/TRDRNA2_/TRDRNA2_175841_c2_seq12:341-1078(-)
MGISAAACFSDPDVNGFDPARHRPIAVSFTGNIHKNRDGGNRVRPMLNTIFKYHHAKQFALNNTHSLIWCATAQKTGRDEQACGVSLKNVYDVAVNSVFCLEPPGDTLTRSHFYVSIVSGCIPVIFDGGHDLYKDEPTQWPWRSTFATQLPFSVDYAEFAVVFKFSTMGFNKSSLQSDYLRNDVIAILLDLLRNDPEHMLELRRNLDKVAPLMVYSTQKNTTSDSFHAFYNLVRTLTASGTITMQ